MTTFTKIMTGGTATISRVKRSTADLPALLNRLAQASPSLIAKPELMAYAPNR